MTKSKAFIIVAVLLVLVSVFGAWTGSNDVAEVRYADTMLYSAYANENIYYTTKEEVGPVYTPGYCPFYYGLSDLTNACGSVAGAEIVAYYDKYFPDLIPDWVSYYTASGKYRIQDFTHVPALMRELYTLMRTNVDDVGVSRTDFLNGLESYVNSNGHQVSYQSVMSGKSIDYEQCKQAINNNKIIVLFALPTNVYGIGSGNGYDNISSVSISSAHIMVVFGYLQVKYYNASGLFRTDTYLDVAVGKSGYTSMYYKVDSDTTEAAYIVNIQ